MFRRDAKAGSVYWLGTRDATGAFLDGGKTYKLTVPLPVPARLFWSVTIYDPLNRSEIQTDQGKAALRSLFELKGKTGSSVDLYFGPTAPAGHEGEWIKTIPGKGWFVYFRIYGPETPVVDGSWKPGDFELVK
jgi:hypothetical protein